jgi:hypothetical protein
MPEGASASLGMDVTEPFGSKWRAALSIAATHP